MKITVDNDDLKAGPEDRLVTEPAEQIQILCVSIAHADQSKGWEVRALKALAAAVATPGHPLNFALFDAAVAVAIEEGVVRSEAHGFVDEAYDIAWSTLS